MARVAVPADVPTLVYAGGVIDVAIGNDGSYPLSLNTTDPKADGALLRVHAGDAVFLTAGSKHAASEWYAYSEISTRVVVTTFP